jgi:hypothetical protein
MGVWFVKKSGPGRKEDHYIDELYIDELSIHDWISAQQVNMRLMRVFTSFPWTKLKY